MASRTKIGVSTLLKDGFVERRGEEREKKGGDILIAPDCDRSREAGRGKGGSRRATTSAARMGKGLRSKIKKKFRTIKRTVVDPFYTEKLKLCAEDLPVPVRPAETPESLARRNDPRKKDSRLGCAAFVLAFPGGVTGDENRRGGVGNHPSCPPVELEVKKQREIDEYNQQQRAEYEEGRRLAAAEGVRLAKLRADKMEVEGPTKLIKKRKLKGNRSKSESSFKRSQN